MNFSLPSMSIPQFGLGSFSTSFAAAQAQFSALPLYGQVLTAGLLLAVAAAVVYGTFKGGKYFFGKGVELASAFFDLITKPFRTEKPASGLENTTSLWSRLRDLVKSCYSNVVAFPPAGTKGNPAAAEAIVAAAEAIVAEARAEKARAAAAAARAAKARAAAAEAIAAEARAAEAIVAEARAAKARAAAVTLGEQGNQDGQRRGPGN
jgi:hypothetical protein